MDKQHILDEIARTAEGNNGVPLGRRRFFTETGIRESDWIGKYWVRWSDAVREAGYAPNLMQTSYDDDWLLEQLVCFIREIGRFPVSAEFRLKSRNDPEFPNQKTFSRFGKKPQIAAKVVDYCRNRRGYEDVIKICEPLAEEPTEETEIKPDVEDFGYVYLIKSGKYYKIGRSKSIGRRKYELALQLPNKVQPIHTIKTDDPVGIEAYWHKRFEEKRKSGEWFELTSKDVAAFRRRKFM